PEPEPESEDDTPEAEPEPEDFSMIDEAVRIAIENEDVDGLLELIRDNPNVPSCINARSTLELYLRRELVDARTYRVDISYPKYPSKIPRRENIDLAFAIGGRALAKGDWPITEWKGGKLFVTPLDDSTTYTLTATHSPTPENKAKVDLNLSRDNIVFEYDYASSEKVDVDFSIEAGTPPYILRIQRESEGTLFDMEGGIKIYGDTTFTTERLARAFKIQEEGNYMFFVEDASRLKKTGVNLIRLTPPPPIPPIVWYIAGIALFVFFLGWLIWRREQRRKDEEMQRLLDARGGSKPRVKRKPKPELTNFWKETAISDLSLHKNFIREIATYLTERPQLPSDTPMIEGVILGTVLKFDFENEQYEVRLDRFRALPPKPLDFYRDKQDHDKWMEIREVVEDHRELVKIGWLQVVENRPMELGELEQQFQDEQFSELFQLMVKIDIMDDERQCGFFTRTTSGKINNARDRQDDVDYWLDWDKLENAGYYVAEPKPVRNPGDDRVKVKTKIDTGVA
ncbi:MAG: hypothetical protein AAF570_03965, partial [Bacteroidota bacterium]